MTEPELTTRERRFHAFHRCGRLLSGTRPQSVRDRLATLTADADLSGYDLDRSQDLYGDGVIRALEEQVADLLGKPDAAFFPTGTMAQQVALRYWADRSGNRTVAMHPLSHPELWEHRAYQRLGGLTSVWPTEEPRVPTPDELRDCEEKFGTLMLELPLRDAGFILPSWDELVAAVGAVEGVHVHLDGARIWESVYHLGHSLPEIAALGDSIYVSFYKTLEGISGAALAGSADFVREAKVWRHRYGGSLYQQWPVALSALAGLERTLPRLESYVAQAKVVADTLRKIPGARLVPEAPHTHQFQLWLPYGAGELTEATLRLAEEQGVGLFGWWDEPGPVPGHSMTEMTIASAALEWTPEEIEEAVAAFLELLR
ncbi:MULTISPECIES: low specificity L-threonine aldolase [unclassified Kitasatospora]|uniref:threonine aldolase family protein n=1 Tax=unclassified Kitasatospora TaxID=2633591 RepID=UPI00070DCE71|nr:MULTISPECIES: beta-eliminating lyase-related protein [unclassified Kitasatospora]KQV18686.1 threonine aldolase [Kitasatospora sp. Root107]KRB74668.1 threonine aldolase [Kitasatospora sp. Root187]